MNLKSLLTTILLTFSLASCATSKHSESAGQYLDSSAITAKVSSKLMTTEGVTGTAIEVETYKGTVILSGFVDSATEKEKAVEVAKAVKGVRDVKDALYVKSEFTE